MVLSKYAITSNALTQRLLKSLVEKHISKSQQNVRIPVSNSCSVSSPQIHSARQGLNSPTWKHTDDKLVKSQLCPVGGAVVPAKVSPSCEGEATISTSAGLGSFVFPPAFWSLLKLCSFFLPSCPVCCTIHNSIFFPSSLYDFIVFYKKKKKNSWKKHSKPRKQKLI